MVSTLQLPLRTSCACGKWSRAAVHIIYATQGPMILQTTRRTELNGGVLRRCVRSGHVQSSDALISNPSFALNVPMQAPATTSVG